MQRPIENNDPYSEPSFGLYSRIERQMWNFVYTFFFKTSPRLAYSWRRFLLKLFGAKIGCGFNVQPSTKIWIPRNLIVGDHVGIGEDVHLYNMDLISIGSYTSISMGATLCCGTHDYNSINHQLTTLKIKIGMHCWICAESFIHPGLTIPNGVVLGARSVLMRSPEKEWFVYSGFPAIAIKERVKKAMSV